MYAAGQSFLGGHAMTVYNTAGSLVHSSTFSATAPNSANQQTVLIGDTRVQEVFGVAPDLVDSGLTISAAGGAACWNAGGLPADCVAWGNFSGGAALQLATGTAVGSPVSPGGIAAGKAIRRTIEPGCPTLLEESDDSDNSATDFSEVTPAPRNDSSPISEHTCAGAPNTAIDDKPPLRSNSSSAEFTYEAPTATSYECKLDAMAFGACPIGGPVEYTGLADGSHTFQVRGVNASGPDPTPASYTWTVDTTPPLATIDTHPADPSPGATAQFTYHAPNETGASFKCALDGALPSACPTSGMTYHGLADGEHTFAVEATDGAGNQQLTRLSSAGRSTTRCSTRRHRRRRSSRDHPTRAKARAPASPTPRMSRAPASNARSTPRPSRAARPTASPTAAWATAPTPSRYAPPTPVPTPIRAPPATASRSRSRRRRHQCSPPRPRRHQPSRPPARPRRSRQRRHSPSPPYTRTTAHRPSALAPAGRARASSASSTAARSAPAAPPLPPRSSASDHTLCRSAL